VSLITVLSLEPDPYTNTLVPEILYLDEMWSPDEVYDIVDTIADLLIKGKPFNIWFVVIVIIRLMKHQALSRRSLPYAARCNLVTITWILLTSNQALLRYETHRHLLCISTSGARV
jgi:hypothetical protein